MQTVENVFPREELRSVARSVKDSNSRMSVRHSVVEEYVSKGWSVERELRSIVKLTKPKDRPTILQDRFWTLMYLMGFKRLSGGEGAYLRDAQQRVTDQIDVFAQDDEVTVLAECKYSGSSSTRLNYSEVLGRLHGLRQPLGNALRSEGNAKFRIAPILIVEGSRIHEQALQRSADLGVPILSEQDLRYFEELVAHIGPAARFQFLADLLPGKEIDGLKMRVPAVRGRLGDATCYTFSAHPSDLLKIAYVSHRAKGQGSDVNTYQRMIKRSRLQSIRAYLAEGGMFPTNIVINLTNKPRFDLANQDGQITDESRVGWLHLDAKYKSAWIIDGQHRLFAYSGLSVASRDYLTVVALENVDASTQAQLFVDINGEQRKVKRSLLQELFAELHWNSTDPKTRTKGVVSKAIQGLDRDDPDSPFFGRILGSEGSSNTPTRCLTITTLFSALENSKLFVERRASSNNTSYGPLWFESDNSRMVSRVKAVLDCWFCSIRNSCPDWWALGKAPGGGLAMNDSVSANIEALKRVLEHIQSTPAVDLLSATDGHLVKLITPFADAAGDYLASLSSDERLSYRSLRGIQGQSTRSKMIQVGIRDRIPEFDPGDLDDFVDSRKKETIKRAADLIQEFEVIIKASVVNVLENELGENEWWMEGVPQKVRVRASADREADKGANGGPENYLYLIDYRDIVEKNWRMFESTFRLIQSNKRDERTSWMVRLNDLRNVSSHPSKGRVISTEELAELESFFADFNARVSDLLNEPPPNI